MEHGQPIVYVCPPAGWALAPLFEALPDTGEQHLGTLVLAPEAGDVLDTANALHTSSPAPSRRIHPLTGLARTERLLQAGAVDTLVATPADALYLVRRATLKADQLQRLAVVWPEAMATVGCLDDAETILGDAANAQRIIVTIDERAVADFVERHARRAPTAVLSRIPEDGVHDVQFAVVEPHARVTAARAALDILGATTAVVWDPVDGAKWTKLADPDLALISETDVTHADMLIASDLPSVEALAAFSEFADRVLVFVRASQIAYLTRITSTIKPLRLPGHTDRVRSEAERLRNEVRRQLEHGDLSTALLAIEPLLEEYDPALIAAAALSGRLETMPAYEDAAAPPTDTATWTKLFVTAGRRDRVGAREIVGAILGTEGIERTDVGRIDVKESFSLVEIRPELADRAIRCLTGEKIGGRRVTVRLDRHESSEKNRSDRADR